MGNRLFYCALTGILFFSTGCASIIGQSKYAVPINSTPPGATVEVVDEDGRQIFSGTTPATVTLRSGEAYFDRQSYVVTVKKDGFNPQMTNLRGEINGWYWGNLLLGGVIGMLIVDPLTGAMYELDTRSVNLSLPASGASVVENSPPAASPPVVKSAKVSESKPVAEHLRELKKLKDEGILTEDEYKTKKKAALDRI